MTFFTRIKIVGRENIIPRLDEDFRHFCRKSPRAYVDTARRRYFDKTVKEAQPGTIALLLLCTELFIDPLLFRLRPPTGRSHCKHAAKSCFRPLAA